MHRHEIIHRDIKLENIVLSHVFIIKLREWQKFAILAGLSTVPVSLGLLFAEPLFISLLKYFKEKNIIGRLILGH